MKFKYALVTFLAVVGIAFAAVAATNGACERYTTCLATSAGEDGGASLDAIPQTYTETNSTQVMIPVITVVSGATDDTGDEVAALVGVNCHDVIVLDEAGGAGDEFTASTCATDNADASIVIMFTK